MVKITAVTLSPITKRSLSFIFAGGAWITLAGRDIAGHDALRFRLALRLRALSAFGRHADELLTPEVEVMVRPRIGARLGGCDGGEHRDGGEGDSLVLVMRRPQADRGGGDGGPSRRVPARHLRR